MRLEAGGGRVAELLQALAPFDERRALADQAFEFDRADFRAVLLLLAAFLRLLVGVEQSLDAGCGAMEAVDRRPEERFEVGVEARIGERSRQGVEDVGDGAFDGFVFRQGSRVGLARGAACSRAVPTGREGVRWGMRRGRARGLPCLMSWGSPVVGLTATIAAFVATPRGRRNGPAPLAAEAQRRTAGGGYFVSRCKASGVISVRS